MPKLKTHKGANRRFHVTGSGKIMRIKGGKSHLRRKKPGRVKRLYDKKLPLHPLGQGPDKEAHPLFLIIKKIQKLLKSKPFITERQPQRAKKED